MKKNRHRRETNPNGGNMLITNVLCGRSIPASLLAGGVHRRRKTPRIYPICGISVKLYHHRRETNPNGGNILITNVLCGRGMPASLPAGGVHRHREPNKSALSAEISVKKSSSARMKNHHQSEQYRFSINNIDALCLRCCYAIIHHMVTTNGTEKSVTKP